MRVVFNSPRMAREWVEACHALRLIIYWTLDNVWPNGDHRTIPDFVFTSIGRTAEENEEIGGHKFSPHVSAPRWRAADVRNRTLNDAQKAEIVQKVNARFVYDPKRPFLSVLLNNDKWGTADHFHFQTHHNTTRRDL